mmetsp:Transcript_3731/g.7525  ORF Transcript_3731/g.7525 Transcript_3731/m.7525 type:complete len:202 (-) Transcript_3731:755-1360(-)
MLPLRRLVHSLAPEAESLPDMLVAPPLVPKLDAPTLSLPRLPILLSSSLLLLLLPFLSLPLLTLSMVISSSTILSSCSCISSPSMLSRSNANSFIDSLTMSCRVIRAFLVGETGLADWDDGPDTITSRNFSNLSGVAISLTKKSLSSINSFGRHSASSSQFLVLSLTSSFSFHLIWLAILLSFLLSHSCSQLASHSMLRPY